ncbi:MAG: hypothetical protein JXA60_01445 [Candidatus Coatesbacteria bacterium]|nr:hypothetical protein [Candidatus Coatesbacteria bacterium]
MFFNPQILFYLGMSFLGFIAGFIPLWTGCNISPVISIVVLLFGGAFIYTIIYNRDKEIALLLSTNIIVFSIFLVMGTTIGQEFRSATLRRQQQQAIPTSRLSIQNREKFQASEIFSRKNEQKKSSESLHSAKDSLFKKMSSNVDSLKKEATNIKDEKKKEDKGKTKK